MTDLMEPGAATGRRARPGPRRPGPAGPRIDPRIAQRWVDARRQEGRRRLRVLAVMAAVVTVAAMAVGVLYSPMLAVGQVRVTVTTAPGAGAALGAARVRAEAGLVHHPLMIELSAAAAARRLDADPVLGGARVTKHWPSTVTVTVDQRAPVAQVAVTPSGAGGAGTYALVDSTGRVLAPAGPMVPGLPVVEGVGAAPAAGRWIPGSAGPSADPTAAAAELVDMTAASDGPDVPAGPAAALAFLRALPADLRSAVQTISAGPGPALVVVVAPPRVAVGTVRMDLGDGSQLAAKVTAFDTLLGQADLTGVTSIDLSVPTRPAATTSTPGSGTSTSGSGSPSGAAASGSGSASAAAPPASGGAAGRPTAGSAP